MFFSTNYDVISTKYKYQPHGTIGGTLATGRISGDLTTIYTLHEITLYGSLAKSNSILNENRMAGGYIQH